MNKQQLKKTTTEGDFIFHKQWLEIFQGFSVEKAGQIIKALVDYAKDGIRPADPEIAAICTFLFANVDIDRECIAAAHAPRKKATAEKNTAEKESKTDEKPQSHQEPSPRAEEESPKLGMTQKEKNLWEKLKRKYHYYGYIPLRSPEGLYLRYNLETAFNLMTSNGYKLANFMSSK